MKGANMIVGILLLGVGLIYLLRNLGIIQVPFGFGEVLFPLLLIIAGGYLILWSSKYRKFKFLIRDHKDKIDRR